MAALLVAVLTLLSVSVVAILNRRASESAVCMRIEFPPETPGNEQTAFAWGVMHATPHLINGGYFVADRLLLLKLRHASDAERLRGLGRFPLFLLGLGPSTSAHLSARVVDCASVSWD